MNHVAVTKHIHSWIETEFAGQMYGVPCKDDAVHLPPKWKMSKSFFLPDTMVRSGRPDKHEVLKRVRPIIAEFVRDLIVLPRELVYDVPTGNFLWIDEWYDAQHRCFMFELSLHYNVIK